MLAAGATIISDGVFKVDGGAIFGRIPKMIWEDRVSTDRKNRVTMGLNCLLLRCGGKNILVDTGIGPKDNIQDKEMYGLVPSRLMRSLKALGWGRVMWTGWCCRTCISATPGAQPGWTGRGIWCRLSPRQPTMSSGAAGRRRISPRRATRTLSGPTTCRRLRNGGSWSCWTGIRSCFRG